MLFYIIHNIFVKWELVAIWVNAQTFF
jgi:hypothetical protein